MQDHPKKGQKLTIKNGPLKGKQFEVINYLVTQYQGKRIEKIKASHLTTAMVNRGHPLDNDTVFGMFWPEMSYGCVHDSELKVKLEPVSGGEAVDATGAVNAPSSDAGGSIPPAPTTNVSSIRKGKRKKKDETQTPAG